jgi:hypothetical protein
MAHLPYERQVIDSDEERASLPQGEIKGDHRNAVFCLDGGERLSIPTAFLYAQLARSKQHEVDIYIGLIHPSIALCLCQLLDKYIDLTEPWIGALGNHVRPFASSYGSSIMAN